MGTTKDITNAVGTEPATAPADQGQQVSHELLTILAGPVIVALNAIKANPTWENVVVQFPALAASETAQLPSAQGDVITAAADFLLGHIQKIVPTSAATAPAADPATPIAPV